MSARTQALPDVARLARRALERDVAWRARSAARRLVALADRGLATSGLSHAQFILMCLIASATDDTVNALAQRAGLDQSTMSRNLDVLVNAQLAEVTTALGDRRRRAVWLTETGLFALARAIRVASKLQPKIESAAAQGWALLDSAKRDSARENAATPARRS
ncbi:MAG TPA: MarR family winged helix-turn-helix transcriptional regulator [Burkholderiaceae bacterium]|nr:MarR family winged helix-turn-helix transcriptional regulator [Burkholderiaceae bacterium]